MILDDRESELLLAARELVLRQRELLPLLEKMLGTTAYEHWILRRGSRSDRDWASPPWRFNFHGLELDIIHQTDGRLVRVDFGPRGRREVFTPWGLGQLICSSRAPWREFGRLRRECDCDGDFPRTNVYDPLAQSLLRKGVFQRACDSLPDAVAEADPYDDVLAQHLVLAQ
jgi:hypothetical protein